MKREILTAVMFSLLLPATGFAANVGGLSSSVGKHRFSFCANIGYLLRETKNRAMGEKEVSSRQFLFNANYGLFDRLDLYGEIGVADLKIEQDEFQGALSTIYGGGVKLSLLPLTSEGVNFLLDGQILAFSNKDGDSEVDFLEYQGAAIICFKSNNFATYGGVRVSQVVIDYEPRGTLKAKNQVGIFLGMDYFVNPKVFFTGEMHNFDQDALYLGVGYKL